QAEDGSWLPLWFGNQDRPDEDNPIYGTSKVLMAYGELGLSDKSQESQLALSFLREQQNTDGGWGGGESLSYQVKCKVTADWQLATKSVASGTQSAVKPVSTTDKGAFSTIEETSLAVEALIACGGDYRADRSIMRGISWLMQAVESEHLDTSWPIGFYFAKLWYYEDLYPAIFALGALGSALSKQSCGTTASFKG
ncbi:MAG: hypothetical protein AAF483_21405, partial [Planctomycetota bacterium]